MIVHAGAWDIPDNLVGAHEECCLAAAGAGWQVLERGGSALDAVEEAIRRMEDHPAVDAGVGSFLNAAGEIELDAGLMDGTTLAVGSVAAVQRVRNPISLARRIMESEHVLLVGEGASRFADAQGIERCSSAALVVPRELARWEMITASDSFQSRQAFVHAGDTVGAVALDAAGDIAAGCSTGGTAHKLPGRVGDSPLVGAGFYAQSDLGGASCTGWGESIMRVVLAKTAVDRLGQTAAPDAATWAIAHLQQKVGGLGGIIVLDREGRIGLAYNTPRMAHAYMHRGLASPVVGV
jgi:beta-aspartyl-peptidase (threonine type)